MGGGMSLSLSQAKAPSSVPSPHATQPQTPSPSVELLSREFQGGELSGGCTIFLEEQHGAGWRHCFSALYPAPTGEPFRKEFRWRGGIGCGGGGVDGGRGGGSLWQTRLSALRQCNPPMELLRSTKLPHRSLRKPQKRLRIQSSTSSSYCCIYINNIPQLLSHTACK